MKARFKLHASDIDDMDATLHATMKIKEWREVARFLNKGLTTMGHRTVNNAHRAYGNYPAAKAIDFLAAVKALAEATVKHYEEYEQ
jgi:hypothetical protein